MHFHFSVRVDVDVQSAALCISIGAGVRALDPNVIRRMVKQAPKKAASAMEPRNETCGARLLTLMIPAYQGLAPLACS